jgi:D-alanyl-D-alanine carboxypeptidase (penicillin-binding protein 5/6)
MIAAYAMHNEDFARIVSTKSMTIPKSGESWNRTLTNKNKILWQYEGGNGVKTGYTRAAGRCLVAAAERDGMQLIAVVLNCGPMFEDCMALMDYGFENYECKCVLEAGVRITDMALIGAMENEVPLIAKESIILPLKKDGSETPVFTVDAQAAYGGGVVFGQTAGAVTASVGGVSVSVPLMVSRSVAESTFLNRLKARLERWYTHLIYN